MGTVSVHGDGALGTQALAAAALHAGGGAVHEAPEVAVLGPIQGARGAEHGAHAAGAAGIGVDEHAPDGAVLHGVGRRLAQAVQVVVQQRAPGGNEAREGALGVHLAVAGAHWLRRGRVVGQSQPVGHGLGSKTCGSLLCTGEEGAAARVGRRLASGITGGVGHRCGRAVAAGGGGIACGVGATTGLLDLRGGLLGGALGPGGQGALGRGEPCGHLVGELHGER